MTVEVTLKVQIPVPDILTDPEDAIDWAFENVDETLDGIARWSWVIIDGEEVI
jgi:hypothetical protein